MPEIRGGASVFGGLRRRIALRLPGAGSESIMEGTRGRDAKKTVLAG
ncbi:hypothetical protein OH687_29645 [Burkholderia anthina]|nr:hypothetical protein OH687_29645 [Burkholderia anthina]